MTGVVATAAQDVAADAAQSTEPPSVRTRVGWWLAATPLVIVPACAELQRSGDANVRIDQVELFLVFAVATFTDLRWRRIPNWLTYSALLWALALNRVAVWIWTALTASVTPWSEMFGAAGVGGSWWGALVGFLIAAAIYVYSGHGGGDVKLITVVGAFLGPKPVVLVTCYGFILAAVVAVSFVIYREGPLNLLGGFLRAIGNRLLPSRVDPPTTQQKSLLMRPLPLAPFLSTGGVLVVWGM